MQLKQLMTAIVAGMAFAFTGLVSAHTQYTWQGGDPGNETRWDWAPNWDCNQCGHYPGEVSDDAVVNVPARSDDPVISTSIPNEIETLNVTDGAQLLIQDTGSFKVAGSSSLVVEPGGEVVIEGQVTANDVTIEAGSTTTGAIRVQHGDAEFTIEGELEVEANGSQLALLQIGNRSVGGTIKFTAAKTHVVAGSMEFVHKDSAMSIEDNVFFEPHDNGSGLVHGQIIGNHDLVEIIIDATSGDVTTTSGVGVYGHMQFTARGGNSATFKNEFEVFADVPGGIMRFGQGLYLDDCSAALWMAESEGTLAFHEEVLTLEAPFALTDCSEIFLADALSIATSGPLQFPIAGTVSVDSNPQYTFSTVNITVEEPTTFGMCP